MKKAYVLAMGLLMSPLAVAAGDEMGAGAVDNGYSNGIEQGFGAMEAENPNNTPQIDDNNGTNNSMTRDGETMGEED